MSTIRRPRGGVRPRRFTKAEYYRLGELGFFIGQRVELIEGRLMVASPQNAAHWTAVEAVREQLTLVFGTGYSVRMQGPLDLGQTTEPEPDVAVVAAYGLILPKAILDAVTLGCFNLHASLLPRWRGAAPINRAVMAGDAQSGVTVMKMDEGLDTGGRAGHFDHDVGAGYLEPEVPRLGNGGCGVVCHVWRDLQAHEPVSPVSAMASATWLQPTPAM